MNRVEVEWGGPPVVGGGLSVFYFAESASGYVADLHDFFGAINELFPAGLSLHCNSSGDVVDDATGNLEGVWSDGSVWNETGGSGSYWPAGAGARVSWRTAGRRHNRRVRGTTFLVPLASSNFNAGFIADASRTTIQAAADALVAAQPGAMLIWSRPSPGTSDGVSNAVTSASTPVEVTSLRSRRV